MAASADELPQQKQLDDEWQEVPQALVFKDVRLRYRRLEAPSLSSSTTSYNPCHRPLQRTHCVVEISEDESFNDSSRIAFFLGETFGHMEEESPAADRWCPPLESARVNVSSWVGVAALSLLPGECALFEPATAAIQESTGGLVGTRKLRLVTASRASDLLGDGTLMLRVLDPGPSLSKGVKPRDLAKVRAGWNVWFLRNGEEVLRAMQGFEFVLDDESGLMVALELGLKDMEVGSRAALRVNQDWGAGPLTPDPSGLTLRGAAVWVELSLYEATNEMEPGGHSNVEEAILFAAEKKELGNKRLSSGGASDIGRALRRYDAGIRVLQALLPQPAVKPKGPTPDPVVGPLAEPVDVPRVEHALNVLRLNSAQAQLKRSKWREAANCCSLVVEKVAEIDPMHIKARYRRGLARIELAEHGSAIEDLRCVALANPADSNTRRELARAEKLYRDHRAKEKSAFSGVFDKMKVADEKKNAIDAAQQEKLKKAEEEEESLRQKTEAEAKTKETENKPPIRLNNNSTEPPQDEMQQPAQQNDGCIQPGKPVTPKSVEQHVGTWSPMSAPTDPEVELQGKVKEIADALNKSNPGRNFQPMPTPTVTEAPPPVEYQVPSFLKGAKKKTGGSK